MRLAIVVVVSGCAYHPGSFDSLSGRFPGERVELGCLDLAVAVDASRTVIDYHFGNRCTHRVMVDLASVRVVAHDGAGGERELRAYDPRGEIAAMPLDALLFGDESIEYRDARGSAELCVDVGGVDGSVPRSERWICGGG